MWSVIEYFVPKFITKECGQIKDFVIIYHVLFYCQMFKGKYINYLANLGDVSD